MSTFIDRNELLIYLRRAIKDELYNKSPLRNEFQVRPIDSAEVIILNYTTDAHVIDEKSMQVVKIQSEKTSLYVPLFEIGDFLKVPNNAFTIEKKELLDSLVKQSVILKEEEKLYEKMKPYKGKGVFTILVDLQCLPCFDTNTKELSFSIFENVGLAKIN
jgi:hypothetical protein